MNRRALSRPDHRGIAARTFERNYQLAEHVAVKRARLENGLLHVDFVRETGGDEASGDPNHELQQAFGGQTDQGRCLRL